MKILKCKYCPEKINNVDTTKGGHLGFQLECPSCNKVNVYRYDEVDDWIVKNEDTVNHPSHYNKYEREVIDSIRGLCTADEYRGYLKGNQIKYLARYQDKNGLEDLRKHRWYVDALIEFEEGRE